MMSEKKWSYGGEMTKTDEPVTHDSGGDAS